MRAESVTDEIAIQRAYYARTAADYDKMHLSGRCEHDFALAFMSSMINFLQIQSVLDIGSGTGRALLDLKASHTGIKVIGLEPSAALREMGHAKGLSESELIEGDAQNLGFASGEFDLVCEFGALHHIPNPGKAVREMLRVAGKAVFISDSNNFGQGTFFNRTVKQILRALRLWTIADFVKTSGKGYIISEGDGLAYSYSVFDEYKQISSQCSSVHVVNTLPSGINPYRSSPHVALLGIK